MSQAERFPAWRLRRLNARQRKAYDRLLWYSPGLAERARCKEILGWRRTRAETQALAAELVAELGNRTLVAERLGVGVRYLDRLLDGPASGNSPQKSRTGETSRKNQAISSGFVRLSRDAKVVVPPALAGRQMYAGDPFSYDLQTALRGVA